MRSVRWASCAEAGKPENVDGSEAPRTEAEHALDCTAVLQNLGQKMSLLAQKFTRILVGTTGMNNPKSSQENFTVFAYGLYNVIHRPLVLFFSYTMLRAQLLAK